MKYQLFTGLLSLSLLSACGSHEAHGHENETPAQELPTAHAENSDEIILSPEKAEAAGVKTEVVRHGSFRNVIQAGGQILPAPGDETTLVASVAGVVSFPHPLAEGTQVSPGAVLLTVSSENLQDGDPVKRARIAYETAKDEYERAAKLVDKQIVSRTEFNGLKEAYENARLAYEALSPSRDGKGVAIKSPAGGYVKACMVKEGDYVAMGQPLLSVTRNRRLQLKAEVSERYYPMLSRVTSANFRTPYNEQVYRLDDLQGRLLSYGRASDTSSFYIPVTFSFDNRGDLLAGSFVEVYLLSDERTGVISLPVSAITEEQGLNFVYLQTDAECYRKQEVTTGATDGSRVEILSGLKGGEKVVTAGAIHVKLASASNSIPGHTHNH